jgi:hypothetical protein
MVRVLISRDDAAMQVEKDNQFLFFSYDHNQKASANSGFISSNIMPDFWKESQSFEIHGLDESAIEGFVDVAVNRNDLISIGLSANEYAHKNFFKGTTFGGKSENSFGYVAMLLKVGLKDYKLETEVKWKWSSGDLIRYVQQIRWKTLKVNKI